MSIARNIICTLAIGFSMGSAFGAPTSESFVSGTGTLDFHDNAFRVNQLLWVSTKSRIAAPASLPPNTAIYSPSTGTVALSFDSASISEVDGKASFNAANSHVELYSLFQMEDENGDPLATSLNLITLENITIDLSDASVSANVISYAGTTTSATLVSDHGRLKVFQGMAPITDGTQGLIVNGQASGSTVGGLMLAPEARDIVINALYGANWGTPLDTENPSGIYHVASTMNWGTASALGTFTSAVPETSTHWMMFTGLLGLFAFNRRSRR